MSTLDGSRGRWPMADDAPSLYLDRTRCRISIPAHTADLNHHTEITIQVVPKMKYELRLLVDDEERELQRIRNRTWEPAKPLYVPRFFYTCTCQGLCICRDASPTSRMLVEVQVQSGLLSWGKKEQGGNEIDCQALFNDYWSTTAHEFLLRGQLLSPTSLLSLTERAQWTLLLGSILALWNYNSLQTLPFVFWKLSTAGCL